MRLKQLEIKGFKSFADKTIVNFDEGITGIIGPNGCGKSNIIDSIRWVIGEQKISQLRSENLDALVFNGSKNRSASGMAEVSLTFENTRNLLPTEFSTVTVTRRFFKNGDSEYRLNDVSCRLKDIQNLFMDTGISTDSYAIIELGMVDDIIKDKDNSRRRMLEQAAGITIYKTRKKEAKQKLDATEQDLARIEDLLFEINNQLKTLESQARKAERYYEIKKEYKEASIELAKASLHGFNDTYKELIDKIQTESERKIQLEQDILAEELKLEDDKNHYLEQEVKLQQLQHAFQELQQQLRTEENEKNLSIQRFEHLREKETSYKSFLEKAATRVEEFQNGISFSERSLTDEQERLQSLQDKIAEARELIEQRKTVFEEKRKLAENLRSGHLQTQRAQFDVEKKAAVSDNHIQNLIRAQVQITEENNYREREIATARQQLDEKEAILENKREDLLSASEQHENAKQKIFATQSDLENLRAELAAENRTLDSKRNEHDLLKSLIDSMEGYPESVKFLHNNQEWNNQSQILSDIIYVEEEYRAALENVLEPYLNYYVVTNEAEALKAVQLLESNKKGKANFFLLDKINNFYFSKKEVPDAISALDVIEVDAPYNKLAEYLLGHVFIAENTDEKSNLQEGVVLLEKNGKLVKGSYTLYGGSIGLFEGKKIGRAKNLEKLNDEIILQEAVVNSLKTEIGKKQSLVVEYNELLKENDIKLLEADVNALNNEVFALKNKLENLSLARDNAVSKLEEIEENLVIERESISRTKDELEELNLKIQSLSEEVQVIERDYIEAEQDYNRSSAAYNESNLEHTRQQSKIMAVEQELNYKKNQLEQLNTDIASNTQQLKESSEMIISAEQSILTKQENIEKLSIKKADQQTLLEATDKAYYAFRNELNEKESTLRQKTKEREATDLLLAEMKDKINELKLQLAGMKERLSVEFRVELDDILGEERTTDRPLEELQANSEKLKKRLDNIGEINPTAIEAYTEMRKRYEFIVEQRDDLVDAKDTLIQTIQEVEATANQQFLTTFNDVRENFQKVFKTLFTEDDTADMVLINPDNLAETGIDIIAKPKGKRPSSITQLSGGEKTLTATALLFSIYLIKPAPFCILDEVDAPLDDANVGKFTNMIQQFSQNSQFIIVTHNKQTMSAVDVIYGVTMQEPGVSKLVPVDFRNLN